MFAGSGGFAGNGEGENTREETGAGAGFRWRYAVAGLQAGVTGALVMLFFIMLVSMLEHHSPWVVCNLLATTFSGSEVYQNRWMPGTRSGIALFLVIYGAGGIPWGVYQGEAGRRGQLIWGGVYGLAVYFVLFDLVWKHWNGLVALYAPSHQLQVAHVIWGMMLSRSPLYARRIAEAGSGHDEVGEVVEVGTGEVIQ